MIYYGMLLVTCGFVEASPACSLDSRMTRSTLMDKVTLDAPAICLNPSAKLASLRDTRAVEVFPFSASQKQVSEGVDLCTSSWCQQLHHPAALASLLR